MKKLILFFIIIGMWVTSLGLASAHTLKVDGNIGVVLHVDPADDPAAGKAATFYFEIKDRQEKFSSGGCECLIIISLGGQEIERATLFENGSESPSIQYVFPKRGVYQIGLEGKPREGAGFQSFKVSYDQRVAKGSVGADGQSESGDNHHSTTDGWWWGVISLFMAAILGTPFVLRRNNKKSSKAHLLLLILMSAFFLQQTALVHSFCRDDNHGHELVHKQCQVTPAFNTPQVSAGSVATEKVERLVFVYQTFDSIKTTVRLSGRSPPTAYFLTVIPANAGIQNQKA